MTFNQMMLGYIAILALCIFCFYIGWAAPHVASLWRWWKIIKDYERQFKQPQYTRSLKAKNKLAEEISEFWLRYRGAMWDLLCFRPDPRLMMLQSKRGVLEFWIVETATYS